MPYEIFDRLAVRMEPLSARTNKKQIETHHVSPDRAPGVLPAGASAAIVQLAERIQTARRQDRPVMLAFGAHAIKNGLSPVLIRLMEDGWVTHLATNGAGIIHDWEFAFQGASCEDVEKMVSQGRFGNWQETGFFINLALNIGAFEGKGYGESVGALIQNEMLAIPSEPELVETATCSLCSQPERSAAAADLLAIIQQFSLTPGRLSVPHPFKRFSAQAAAFRLGVPFTGHPMIGHDIIYTHPMNHGASLGRTAMRDFLTFAENVSRLQGGVYVSIGSAVMSPMVFEKSLSMAKNVAIQRGEKLDDYDIMVVDLARSDWDWSRGEPPETDPGYYLRYNKTFSRMGGTMRYLSADNRDFLLTLSQSLAGKCER